MTYSEKKSKRENALKAIEAFVDSGEAKHMTGREAAKRIGIPTTTLQRYVDVLYNKQVSSVFKKGKRKYDRDEIPFAILTNREIEEEYGMARDYARHVRKSMGLPPDPDYMTAFKSRSQFLSLLTAVDFYDWLRTNGRSTRFTSADLDEYRNQTHGHRRRGRVPEGWFNSKWVAKYSKRKPGRFATVFVFTKKFHQNRKSVGFLSEEEYEHLMK